MNLIFRRGAGVVLVALSVACESSAPTSPTRTGEQPLIPPPSSPPSQPPSPISPPPPGPSQTFIFARALVYPVSNYTMGSRFVLYDNGAFVLQYVTLGSEYRGEYAEANGVISFRWEGVKFGEWGATGTVKGNTLTVSYNFWMEFAGFEDAVYALVP